MQRRAALLVVFGWVLVFVLGVVASAQVMPGGASARIQHHRTHAYDVTFNNASARALAARQVAKAARPSESGPAALRGSRPSPIVLVVAAEGEAASADSFLYQKLSAEGEHLKYGITKSPLTRYTSAEMNGGRLNILATGAKSDMLALERSLHEWLPIGPEEGQAFYILKQIANGLRPPPY